MYLAVCCTSVCSDSGAFDDEDDFKSHRRTQLGGKDK